MVKELTFTKTSTIRVLQIILPCFIVNNTLFD